MSPAATSAAKEKALIEGSIKLVGRHVGEGADGGLHVETTITCQGRTFSGASSGPAVLPDRLKPSALATIRALVGMSDLAIIVATLQATTRIVSHWIAGGHRSAPAEKQERPQ